MIKFLTNLISRQRKPSKRGFTLLELIVVIVVLGILAAIAIPTFAGVITRANDASTATTLQAVISDAKSLYAINQGSTPADWYTSFATAASEVPTASALTIASAPTFTVNVDVPTGDATDPNTYVADITSAGISGASTGASLSRTQLSIGDDVGNHVFGLANLSSSGNCVFATLDTAPGGVSQAWSMGTGIGSNCSASVAVLGKAADLSNVSTLKSSGGSGGGGGGGTPAAPAVPAHFTAVQGGVGIGLSWAPVASTSGAPVDGYYISRSTDPSGPFTLEMQVSSATITYSQDPYTNIGDTYYYEIQAYGSGGVSAFSPATSGVTLTPLASNGYTFNKVLSGTTLAEMGVASNSNGTRLFTDSPNGLNASADSGITWLTPGGSFDPGSVAASGDGKTTLQASYAVGVFISHNYGGAPFSPALGPLAGNSVSISTDGSRMVLTTLNGQLYTSSDSGVTWIVSTTTQPGEEWRKAVVSGDGSKIVAIETNSGSPDHIWTSSNFGSTWKDITSVGGPTAAAVAISSDGSKIAVVDGNTQNIDVSSNFGSSWVSRPGTSSLNVNGYSSIALSSNGTFLAVSGQNFSGQMDVFTSVDFGLTWKSSGLAVSGYSGAQLALSSDGSKIILGVSGGSSGEVWVGDAPGVAPGQQANPATSAPSIAPTLSPPGTPIPGGTESVWWFATPETPGMPITGYYLQQSTSPYGPWTTVYTAPMNLNSQAGAPNAYASPALPAAPSGSSYYYRVAAYNSLGVGTYSATEDTPTP